MVSINLHLLHFIRIEFGSYATEPYQYSYGPAYVQYLRIADGAAYAWIFSNFEDNLKVVGAK